MRWLLASLFMLTVLHVACGRTAFDTPGFGDSAGTGGGAGTGNPLSGVSTGGGGTAEPARGGAAGSTSSAEPNTGDPLPAGSPAGASVVAGTSATRSSAAGNPASRPSSVGGQPGAGGTSMGGRLSMAGTISIMGGSGGTSRSAASGGSSSSGGSCPEVTVCGGDVVGTWEVKSQCLTFDGQTDISYLGLTCIPNVARVKGSLKVTGKLTLGSDGKFNDATITTGSEVWQMDKSCLILSGTRVNCISIGTTFEGALMGYGYESFTCRDADSGGGCTCPTTINTDAPDGRPGGMGILYNDVTTKGAYKTNGNKLMIGDSLNYTYCVKGNEMTVSPIPIDGSATPYRGTIVLTRSPARGTGGTGGTGGTAGAGGRAGGSGGAGRTAP